MMLLCRRIPRRVFVGLVVIVSFCGLYICNYHISIKLEYKGRMWKSREEYDAFTATRFAKRYQRMYSKCIQNHPSSGKFMPDSTILVNENHKIEICVVPKSGSSGWSLLLYKLHCKDNGLPLPNHTTDAIWKYNYGSSRRIKNSHPFDDWQTGVDDDFFTYPNPQKIYRLIASRHPFARLISAWNQKMKKTGSNNIYDRYSKEMSLYNATQPDEDHIMSWEDFAEYISDARMKQFPLEYHFKSASELCNQCRYFFTYIIKLETIDEDFNWLSKRINLPPDISLIGKEGSSVVNEDPSIKIGEFMKRLSVQTVRKLYEAYQQDFIDFGYTFDFNTWIAGGFE